MRGPGGGHRQAEPHHESQCDPEQVTFPSGSTEAPLVSFLVKRGFCPITQQALLGIYPREVRASVHQKTGKSEGSAAFFRSVKTGNEAKVHSQGKNKHIMVCPYDGIQHSNEKDKLLTLAISQMNLTEFMLRKGSQKKQPD